MLRWDSHFNMRTEESLSQHRTDGRGYQLLAILRTTKRSDQLQQING